MTDEKQAPLCLCSCFVVSSQVKCSSVSVATCDKCKSSGFKSSSLSSLLPSWTSSPHHQTCDKCKLKQVQVTETGRIDLDRATHREYSSVKPRNATAESCFTPFHVFLLRSSCPFQVEHHRTCTVFALIHKKWIKMGSDEVLGQIWKSNGWQGKIFEQFETAPAVCLTQLIWFRLTARETHAAVNWRLLVLTFMELWWHRPDDHVLDLHVNMFSL